MLRFLCFLAVVLGVKSASAPFITACRAADSACLVSSAQAAVPFLAPGVPELGVAALDPMLLKVVKADQAGLRLALKNTTVSGMKRCKINKIDLSPELGKLSVVTQCSVVLRGSYKLGGRLLVFPIEGEGKHVIKIRDIVITADTELVTAAGADGRARWRVGRWTTSFDVLTSASFDFENLFNGNRLLADPVQAFVNSHGKEVMQEIAPPVVRGIVARVVAAVNALFAAVPADELYLA